jgi:putative restriction endonuclease
LTIKLIVAVTDQKWFELLRRQAHPEVNFWAPSPAPFRALEPGELFLFKLHSPRNFIVGGGIFTYANRLPVSLAWESFGEGNGARTVEEMRARIAKYRHLDSSDRSDFEIGCRILTQPFFFDEADWLPVPTSWSRNIVSFKGYDTSESEGLAIWRAVQERLTRAPGLGEYDASKAAERFGQPHLIRPRLGQGAFRVLVTDIYGRRCAVTQEKTLPALEAAHIQPYSNGGLHEARNGLLLRRDIHSLFDAGYVTVTPDLKFEVSRHVRDDYGNGRHYYALHGQPINAPDNPALKPDPSALSWHNEHRFKG